MWSRTSKIIRCHATVVYASRLLFRLVSQVLQLTWEFLVLFPVLFWPFEAFRCFPVAPSVPAEYSTHIINITKTTTFLVFSTRSPITWVFVMINHSYYIRKWKCVLPQYFTSIFQLNTWLYGINSRQIMWKNPHVYLKNYVLASHLLCCVISLFGLVLFTRILQELLQQVLQKANHNYIMFIFYGT